MTKYGDGRVRGERVLVGDFVLDESRTEQRDGDGVGLGAGADVLRKCNLLFVGGSMTDGDSNRPDGNGAEWIGVLAHRVLCGV